MPTTSKNPWCKIIHFDDIETERQLFSIYSWRKLDWCECIWVWKDNEIRELKTDFRQTMIKLLDNTDRVIFILDENMPIWDPIWNEEGLRWSDIASTLVEICHELWAVCRIVSYSANSPEIIQSIMNNQSINRVLEKWINVRASQEELKLVIEDELQELNKECSVVSDIEAVEAS